MNSCHSCRYTPAVEGTNRKLQQSVASLDWISYIDCSTIFLSEVVSSTVHRCNCSTLLTQCQHQRSLMQSNLIAVPRSSSFDMRRTRPKSTEPSCRMPYTLLLQDMTNSLSACGQPLPLQPPERLCEATITSTRTVPRETRNKGLAYRMSIQDDLYIVIQ